MDEPDSLEERPKLREELHELIWCWSAAASVLVWGIFERGSSCATAMEVLLVGIVTIREAFGGLLRRI